LSDQFDGGFFVLAIDQKGIEVLVLEAGPSHPRIAARFHSDAEILQNAAEHLDRLGIRAH
jgi:hypothetical protein